MADHGSQNTAKYPETGKSLSSPDERNGNGNEEETTSTEAWGYLLRPLHLHEQLGQERKGERNSWKSWRALAGLGSSWR